MKCSECDSESPWHDYRQHRSWGSSLRSTNPIESATNEGMQLLNGEGGRGLRQGRGHHGGTVDVPEVPQAGTANLVSDTRNEPHAEPRIRNAAGEVVAGPPDEDVDAWVAETQASLRLPVRDPRKVHQKHDLEGGKYTLIQYENGSLEAHRYGEPWREFVGDKFMHSLAEELFVALQRG